MPYCVRLLGLGLSAFGFLPGCCCCCSLYTVAFLLVLRLPRAVGYSIPPPLISALQHVALVYSSFDFGLRVTCFCATDDPLGFKRGDRLPVSVSRCLFRIRDFLTPLFSPFYFFPCLFVKADPSPSVSAPPLRLDWIDYIRDYHFDSSLEREIQTGRGERSSSSQFLYPGSLSDLLTFSQSCQQRH